MGKILGLDLGTNSIGWAVVENKNGEFGFLKDDNNPTKGVIIFPEGAKIEAKSGSIKSRAAERTTYRGARKLKFRRKLRKYETLLVLSENNMCPLSKDEVKAWRKSGFKEYPNKAEFLDWLKTDNFGEKENLEHKTIRQKQVDNPYFFRDRFSRKKYDWKNNSDERNKLGRAFYHLAQRRGFKSNRLEQSDENKISDAKELIQDSLISAGNPAELYKIIQDLFDEYDLKKPKDDLDTTQQKIKTLLNYISKVLSNNIKNRDYSKFEDAKNEISRYINKPENLGPVKGGIRELSEKIEKANCETLGQYFWHLYQENRNDEKNKIRTNYTAREEHYEHEFDVICVTQQIPEGLRAALYKSIFFQRPLKSQKALVGSCTFEKDKPRCPISRPEFEEFRMYSLINHIKIKTQTDENLRLLTNEEKEKIIPRFYLQRNSFKMQEIADILFPKGNQIAYYKEPEAKNAPYVINYKLNTTINGNPVSAALKNLLGKRYDETYITQIHKFSKKNIDVTYYELAWHALFTFDDSKKLEEYAISKLALDETSAKRFIRIPIQQGYSNLSLKAINKILPWLKKGLIYSHAVFMANLEKLVKKELWNNPECRQNLEFGIHEIIESQQDENKKIIAVNSLIKKCINETGFYPDENDLKTKLISVYGTNKWNNIKDQETLLKETYKLLTDHLQVRIRRNPEFAKMKRIDDRVKEYLLGDNPEKIEYCMDSDEIDKHLYHPSDLVSFKPVKAKDKDKNPIIVNQKALEILPLPKTDAIKNPVLIRAMHQLRRLINELLIEGIIDDNTRIHLEMAREINDANKRKAWKLWQDELRDNKENAIQEIKELYKMECEGEIEPTEDDVLRYILWNEQNRREIYEDECKNISICDIVGTNPKYDIEHTIPRSRSWDNSMMNKTLCSKTFNRNDKKNKIPFELGNEKYEEILLRIQHWRDEFEKLDNEIKGIRPSAIQDPDKRNAKIVERHLKTFRRDYLKGKYERFTMDEVPDGFKNSQITDTGLITRFARSYLSCLFRTPNGNSNVHVVNGVAVNQFKRAWGLQKEYEKKSRINHIHHCIDAVTIACMTKDKYDAFAEEWRKAEEAKYDIQINLGKYKPWPTFTENMLKLENEILVVHTNKDSLPKQSKKKVRKRGIIQYKDAAKTEPIYQQGDTVRGSLHKETFYGAIARDIDGNVNRDKEGNIIPNYVVRKELSKLKSSDVKNIVDENIRNIIEKAVDNKLISFNKNGAIVKEIIWQNEEKKIPIKKVRVYTPSVKSPIQGFKKHATPFLSKDNYKQQFNVVNDENYCMAIYEGIKENGEIHRTYELINNLAAGEYYKASNESHRKHYPIVPITDKKMGYPLKVVIKKGQMVLLYNESPDEIWSMPDVERKNRLYEITQLDTEGQPIKLMYHQEARQNKDITKHMGLKNGMKGGKLIDQHEDFPWIKVSPNQFDALVEGIDFKITITGKILPI